MCCSSHDPEARRIAAGMFKLALLFVAVAAIIGFLAWAHCGFPAEPTPVPVPTPASTPVDAESWLAWMDAQPTVEQFWISEFEMPDGDLRPAERVTQVPGAGCRVVSTRGYIQGPSGYWNQGFVENEIVASLRLFPWTLFEGVAYAKDGATSAKTKCSHKFQAKLEKKPSKLKRIKWTKAREIKW